MTNLLFLSFLSKLASFLINSEITECNPLQRHFSQEQDDTSTSAIQCCLPSVRRTGKECWAQGGMQ